MPKAMGWNSRSVKDVLATVREKAPPGELPEVVSSRSSCLATTGRGRMEAAVHLAA